MMNKSEQEMYERAQQCAKNYKEKLDILEEKLFNIQGFCKVRKSVASTHEEVIICEAILKFIRS